MKGNGFKLFSTIALLVLSGYYLYPSLQNYFIQQKLNNLEGEALTEYESENYARIQSVKEQALKLGLDLQGGMHVALEVRIDALLRALAQDVDPAFEQALETAQAQAVSGDASLVDAFVDAFEAQDPDARLSRYFRNETAGITRRSTNEEVRAYLQGQTEDAVTRAIEIIRQRVDRYGVTEPSIQKQGTRRVIVELPGVDDQDRVRRLLRGTARLEFRLTPTDESLANALQQIVSYYETGDAEPVDTLATPGEDEALTQADAPDALPTTNDTTATDTTVDPTTDVGTLLAGGDAAAGSGNRLYDAGFQPVGQGIRFGLVAERDTAAVNALLQDPTVQAMLPTGTELLYDSKVAGTTEDGQELYYLLGVREEAELTGESIVDARVDFDEINQPEVTMVMDAEGGRTWSRITGANVGRPVAIVLDNVVYSYPTVMGKIPSGRSSISGLDSRDEAQDVVTILKSGALPAPVDIVEERTVGPSLGAASIRAGLNSVMLGLLIVALFMVFYYRTAGLVADLALILNMIFILGILAAFNATLTLPGIAGIVLTIGMAVDANVLIFERVREEQGTGKTLKAAVESGYGKALSAIIDANITTFFVGAILYSFGVGPIQGFAVTLMAGILASLFSAIVFTRIIMDYMIIERRASVNFG